MMEFGMKKVTSIKVIITPPFWLTWWFKSLVIIFVISSIYGFYRYRINAVNRQKAELERVVKERTAEVVHQIKRVAGAD